MKYVPKAITRAAGRAALNMQKNSPTILFVAGVGGAVTATVLACRATLKAQPVVEDLKKDLIMLDIQQNRKDIASDEARAARQHMFTHTAIDLTKLYGPAVVVGAVSIACLTKSHRQLTQRNATLTAAYVGLQNFLEGYRGRVRQEIGEEREQDVYYAATPVELVEDDGKKGPKKVYGSTPGMPSPYAVYFQDGNPNWQGTEYDINFIRIQEQLLTDELRANGHLFLNKAYDKLGIMDKDGKPYRTQTGQVCGWFIGHPNSDDFVEIKIIQVHDFHKTLMLDFNVAGHVLHMLDESRKGQK